MHLIQHIILLHGLTFGRAVVVIVVVLWHVSQFKLVSWKLYLKSCNFFDWDSCYLSIFIYICLYVWFQAHARVILLSVYKSEVDRKSTSLSPALQTVLHALVEFYAIYWTLEKTGDLLLVRRGSDDTLNSTNITNTTLFYMYVVYKLKNSRGRKL